MVELNHGEMFHYKLVLKYLDLARLGLMGQGQLHIWDLIILTQIRILD